MDINLFKGNSDKKPAKPSRKDTQVEGKMAVIGNSFNRAVTVAGRVAVVFIVAGAVQSMVTTKAKK